jgi:amino acid adenylation domain-containing protein
MAEMISDFDQFAVEYDFWMQTVQQPSNYQQILDLRPRPESNVLEIGCGTGRLALFLADVCQQVTAIDSSATMIARAEQARRQQGKENITFLLADIESWPLPDAAYDFIVSTYTLHHTDMALTLPRLRRALKPGGRLFVRDLVCNDDERWRTSNRYHIQRALKELPTLVRQHGVQAAWRIMQLRLSPTWIYHLRADQVFSTPIIERIYQDHTPGAVFWANQEEYSVLWNAPADEEEVAPTAPIPKTQASDPNQAAAIALPWHQQSWAPERFAKADVERSLVHVFERQVVQSHHAIAIRMGERTLTYAQLNAQANRLARTLLDRQGSQAEPIAILLDDPIDTIIALLGVLKAGKIYLVLNPEQPAPTLSRICADAGAGLVITNTAQLAAVTAWAITLQSLNLDELSETTSSANLALDLTADHLAGIYYTSGSTGEPKGIIRNHRQLLHSTWHNANAYQITGQDRHSLLYSPSFTAAVPDIFDPLLTGAMLCPFDPKRNSIDELIAWLISEEITLLHPPVPLFRRLLDALQNTQPLIPQLRLLILAGQSIYKPDVERFRRHFAPTCQLLYRLAMTEAGSVTHLVINHTTDIGESIPVGYPTADKEILLLGDDGNVTKPGEVGEIAIHSQYLSSGYWQNPTLTASKFLLDPQNPLQRIYLTGDQGRWQSDGTLEYLGRQDTMVKVRGYRVELGAIEAALRALEQIKECIVIARDDPAGNKQLVAYLVPHTPGLTISKVRQLLMRTLPEYMLPAHFVLLDALPQSLNGKVDAKALPPPGNARPNLDTPFVEPQSELEGALAGIWADLLGIEAIGSHDNFFELGGHSLLAMRLLHEIEQQFQQKLPVQQFMATPTIAHSATLLATDVDLLPTETSLTDDRAVDARLQTIYNELGQPGGLHRLQRQAKLRNPVRSHLGRLLILLPYAERIRTLHWLVRQPWAQQRYWQSRVRLIRDFYAVLDTPVDEATMITNSLFYGLQYQYRLNEPLLHRTPSSQLIRDFIEMEGIDCFEQIKNQGQGVILALMHSIAAPWWRKVSLAQSMVGGVTGILQQARLEPQEYAQHLFTRQLEVARQTLQSGEVVSIADGAQGNSPGIVRAFHGRQRTFRTGFAELALLTGAPVMLVMAEVQPGQKVKFRFTEPLDTGSAGMSHAARVEYLMDQYLMHVHRLWYTRPWMIHWRQMETHLACPATMPGAK